MPFICVNQKGVTKYTSVRFSEYESIETLKILKKVGWFGSTHSKVSQLKKII